MNCPVCGELIEIKSVKCHNCTFEEFQSEFLNKSEYDNWMINSVVPHRDAFVEDLLDKSKQLIIRGKHIAKTELRNNPNQKIKNTEFDNICNEAQECLKTIDLLTIEWLIKSAFKIEYVKHMGFLDHADDEIYMFDLSGEYVKINYERISCEKRVYGTYANIKIKSLDLLDNIFKKCKLHELKHSEDELWSDDGAWWELKVHLKYPNIQKVFSNDSYWSYHERSKGTAENIEGDKMRWINIDSNFFMGCSGEFFNPNYQIVVNAFGNVIEETPKNLKIIQYDEINNDIW